MAEISPDGNGIPHLGGLMCSYDGHGHEWEAASPKQVLDAGNAFLPMESKTGTAQFLSIPQRTHFSALGYPWDRRSFYARGTVWTTNETTGKLESDWMSFKYAYFRGCPMTLEEFVLSPDSELRVEVDADLLDLSKLPADQNRENLKWHTTIYAETNARTEHYVMSYVSKDGINWQYQGTVANNSKSQFPGTNGPTETTTILLPDGRLMATYRVEEGSDLWQSFSSDLGKTWTFGEPVVSATNVTVLPAALALENGVYLLAGGRPGIWLMMSTDPADPKSWKPYDLIENHNRQLSSSNYTYPANPACGDVPHGGCSGYTSMAATSSSTAIVCYDQGIGGDSYIWCVEVFTEI